MRQELALTASDKRGIVPKQASVIARGSASTHAVTAVYLLLATIYHFAPNLILVGIPLLGIGLYAAVRGANILPHLVVFGYLTHSIVSPNSTKLVFSLPVLFWVVMQGVRGSSTPKLGVSRIVLGAWACCAGIIMAILLSELVDPATTTGAAGPLSRVAYVLLCLTVAWSCVKARTRRQLYLSLTVSALYLSVDIMLRVSASGYASARVAFDAADGFIDPNYLAFFILLGLGPCLAVVVGGREFKTSEKFIAAVCSLVLLGGAAMTTSRTGMIGGTALVVYAVAHLLRHRGVTHAVVALVVIGGLALVAMEQFQNMPTFIEGQERWTGAEDVSGLGGRLELAIASVRSFSSLGFREMVFGGGTGANYLFNGGWNTHNGFLEYYLDHGLIGGSLLVILFLMAGANVRVTRDTMASMAGWSTWVTVLLFAMSLGLFSVPYSWVAIAPLLVVVESEGSRERAAVRLSVAVSRGYNRKAK